METTSKKLNFESKCPILDINGKDIIQTLSKYLPYADFVALIRTCKKMQKILSTENVWRCMLERDFQVYKDPIFDINVSHRDIYKQEQKFQKYVDVRSNVEIYLWSLSKNNNTEYVKCCIRRGADINVADKHGWTALMFATRNRCMEVIELLLNKGADIKKTTTYGSNAILIAIEIGYNEVVEFLLNNGADITVANASGKTALMFASQYGNKKVIKLILSKGVNINETDIYGRTPFMFACESGHKEIIDFLLINGADIHKTDIYERTALTAAIENENKEIIEILQNKIKFY